MLFYSSFAMPALILEMTVFTDDSFSFSVGVGILIRMISFSLFF